jgi:hypothetical protein
LYIHIADEERTVTTGEKIATAIDAMNGRDMEMALIHVAHAFDETAKREYPTAKKISERIRKLLKESGDLITFCSFGDAFFSGQKIDEITLEEILYKALRIGLETENPDAMRIEFVHDIVWGNPGGILRVPVNFVYGMLLAVVGARCNAAEKVADSYQAGIIGTNYPINELWGDGEYIRRIMRSPGTRVERNA